MSIVDRLVQHALEQPEVSAVEDGQGGFSYSELDQRSNELAHLILERKRDAGGFVVLMLPRTRHYVSVLMGAHKAGVAAVPVSSAYPADRVNVILKDTVPLLFVTTAALWSAHRGALNVSEESVLLIDRLECETLDATPVDVSFPDDKALVLYTSGTTGRPKGVVHTLASVSAIGSCNPRTERVPGPTYALLAEFGFIAAAYILYESLTNGGTCHIISEDLRTDMAGLAAYLRTHNVDIAFMGSSLGVEMLKTFDLGLRELRLGGEQIVGLTPELAGKVRVVNSYGLSEMAPIATRVLSGGEDPVPVGKPTGDAHVLVLDELGREVPSGTTGEIYVFSSRMALEYLGMSELSEDRFVPSPAAPGGRMLRTGDRGFFDAAGELIVSGRTDGLVKLRGQRIETGEIEAVTQMFPGITGCACVLRKRGGEDHLCLYVEAGSPIDRKAMVSHLSARLPDYMMPSLLVQMDRLPRNERGKINRALLPEATCARHSEVVPPASDNEQLLYDIARKLLPGETFGVTDDLFSLGLSSLTAMKMVAEAEKVKIRIKLTDLTLCRAIRQTLRHDAHMVWWYTPYDPSKDVTVFVHGIAITKNIDRKLRMWNEHDNVLVVEPIQEHYRYIFEGDDITEVADLYYALVDHYLPTGARVRVTTGVSFGGKLAYLIACRLRDGRGQRPVVVMGDSHICCQQDVVDAVLAGTMDHWQAEHKITFNASFLQRMEIMIRTEQGRNEMPAYDGRVVLLHSLAPSVVFPPGNDIRWRRHAANLSVVPLPFRHDAISLDNDDTMIVWEAVARAVRLWDRACVSEESMREVMVSLAPEIRRASLEWTDRIERLPDTALPSEGWKLADEGCGLLHKFDFSAADCQSLFVPIWPMAEIRFAWWLAMFTGAYFFRAEDSPPPAYHADETGGSLFLDAPAKFNTWIYLPTKRVYPSDCALEFDYTTEQTMKETLQLCFAFDTLAERYRFVLNDNASLGFEVVSKGRFFAHDNDEWRRFRTPWSLTLGARTRVRLEISGDTFRLFLNGKGAMAIRVRGHVPHPARLAIIAWNGRDATAMKVRIENLKLFVRENEA